MDLKRERGVLAPSSCFGACVFVLCILRGEKPKEGRSLLGVVQPVPAGAAAAPSVPALSPAVSARGLVPGCSQQSRNLPRLAEPQPSN